MLNGKQVEALFEREAVFIEKDVVPADRVKELFGEQAFDFVTDKASAGRFYNYYGVGGCDFVMFITHSGFMCAASMANALELYKPQKKAEARRG